MLNNNKSINKSNQAATSGNRDFSDKVEHIIYDYDYLMKILDNMPEDLVKNGKDSILCKLIPEFAKIYDKKQPDFHEFNLGEHIVNVYNGLNNMEEFIKLPQNEQKIGLLLALFHDIGKDCPKICLGDKTDININKLNNAGYSAQNIKKVLEYLEKKGNWETIVAHKNHAVPSAKKTREIMSKMKFNQEEINRITNLVGLHMDIGNLAIDMVKDSTNIEYHNKIISLAKSIVNNDDLMLLRVFTIADVASIKKQPKILVTPEWLACLDNIIRDIQQEIAINMVTAQT